MHSFSNWQDDTSYLAGLFARRAKEIIPASEKAGLLGGCLANLQVQLKKLDDYNPEEVQQGVISVNRIFSSCLASVTETEIIGNPEYYTPANQLDLMLRR